MKNTAIIIPTRLEARRFPNKPLAEINSKPMILHVLNKAKKSKVGEVFVATPDKKIFAPSAALVEANIAIIFPASELVSVDVVLATVVTLATWYADFSGFST